MSSCFDYTKIEQMLHLRITWMAQDILDCSGSFQRSFWGFLFAVYCTNMSITVMTSITGQVETMMTKCKNLKKSQPMTPVLIPPRLVPGAMSQTTRRVPSPWTAAIVSLYTCSKIFACFTQCTSVVHHCLVQAHLPVMPMIWSLLCKLVAQIITCCPRQEGNKWKL